MVKFTKEQWLCTVDVDNSQADYAQCLQLVLWLEEITKQGSDNRKLLSEKFYPFYISRLKEYKVNDRRVLLEQENNISMGVSNKFTRIESKDSLVNGLDMTPDSNIFHYYLRIKLSEGESDITELQYLLLVLQSVPDIQNRIAIRFMENDGREWTTSSYFRVSHYLRFIQQKYHCFYACYDERVSSLKLLVENTNGTQSTFLPLLEVNARLCQILNRTWFLQSEYIGQKYDKLHTAIFPKDCEKNDMTWELFDIAFCMLFKNLPGKKYNSANSKQELLRLLCKIAEDIQGITALDMLIFSAIIGDLGGNKLDDKRAKDLMSKVQILSASISQILENIVNHSERNIGAFTFRVQSNEEYLSAHYPNYHSSNNKGSCLEILIADSNRRDDIVRHFLNSNKADSMLKDFAESICLENLFGYFRDARVADIWKKARSKKPEMCHGLRTFAKGVQALSGAIRVRSASDYKSDDHRDIYYYNGDNSNYDEKNLLPKYYIPGTQFGVVIDHLASKNIALLEEMDNDTVLLKEPETGNDWAFKFERTVYTTTYLYLAQALAFDKKMRKLDISSMIERVPADVDSQEKKDELVTLWKDYFNSKIVEAGDNNRVVYICHMDELCKQLSEKRILGESFCKGFLSSRFFINSNKDNYHSILLWNFNAPFMRHFANTLQIIHEQEGFDIQNVSVYLYPEKDNLNYLIYKAATMHTLLGEELNKEVFPEMFPYMLFQEEGKECTLFEETLMEQAKESIYTKDKQGFKIGNTHMRLGNKVHLDAFYEMALFFENPNYAYCTAFLFLRDFLQSRSDVLKKNKHLLFYGYASYSRALVWATIQILKQYNELTGNKNFPDMEFVIYQNDLKVESEEAQIQMYYSKEEWQRDNTSIWNPEDTLLVMMVPISSSLTTFNKMKAELKRATEKEFCVINNFTAFWVRDNYTTENEPTKLESLFWETADNKGKSIVSNIVEGKIKYLVSARCQWSNPLDCKQCFPEDPIHEFPLVETDPTSTVPTQQFYCSKDEEKLFQFSTSDEEEENDRRVARLESNVVYGHISKGNNHYQYYVKTREYFQQERDNVANWLKGLREQADKERNATETSPEGVNILIIPQQVNNVEFGQYVYEYYFKGAAECIIINTEKEFRSNLQAEYGGLFKLLREIKDPHKNIKFHYVDVSIRSGNSFNRIWSLISSCLDLGEHYEFRIEQVFLLVSRLSEASKKRYVSEPKKKFHAYAEMKISAMRNFGDSCVPCKLQQEAKGYYRKASTKEISAYWERKIYKRQCIPFDQLDEIRTDDSELQKKYEDEAKELQWEGYCRMICSHRAAHYIRPIQGAQISEYFRAIRLFLDEICNANTSEEYRIAIYERVNDDNRKDWLAAGLKVIVRPFFSFDYKMRCVVMDLCLLLSEFLIKRADYNDLAKRIHQCEKKHYLQENENLVWIERFAQNIKNAVGSSKYEQLQFVRNNILKGLADIKSNYIMRKDTIIALSNRISEVYVFESDSDKVVAVYEPYLRSILRLTHSSSDETKSVWLEYLLQRGEEYNTQNGLNSTSGGISKLVGEVPENVQGAFRDFLEVLLVENNRPLYQAVLELDKSVNTKRKEENNREIYCTNDMVANLLNEYHMRNAGKFLSLQDKDEEKYEQLCSLQRLLEKLNAKEQGMHRYQELGKIIQKIMESKANNKGRMILYGKNNIENKSPMAEYLKLPPYFILFPEQIEDEIAREKSPEKQMFEEHWNKLSKDEKGKKYLEDKGFYLLASSSGEELYDIFVMFDNNYMKLKEIIGAASQRIEPIYMYIPCQISRQKSLELVRMILLFRKKFIEWLENDFNNEAIAVLSQQKHLAKILSTDKIGHHSDMHFLECVQKLVSSTTEEEYKREEQRGVWDNLGSTTSKEEVRYSKKTYGVMEFLEKDALEAAREWFLIRSYVNAQIAVLYRTMVRTENSLSDKIISDINEFYACTNQIATLCPVKSIKELFFTPIQDGYIRKNYLRQIMKVATFTIGIKHDYEICVDNDVENGDCKKEVTDDVETRIMNFFWLIKDYECIIFGSEKKREKYAYLAEYLAVILFDCFLSCVKYGDRWKKLGGGLKAFRNLSQKQAREKCEIRISRERGERNAKVSFDYLVIENNVYVDDYSSKGGPGMSQAAIRWYIEGIWRYILGEKKYPKVKTDDKGNKYTIKLPILKAEEVDK